MICLTLVFALVFYHCNGIILTWQGHSSFLTGDDHASLSAIDPMLVHGGSHIAMFQHLKHKLICHNGIWRWRWEQLMCLLGENPHNTKPRRLEWVWTNVLKYNGHFIFLYKPITMHRNKPNITYLLTSPSTNNHIENMWLGNYCHAISALDPDSIKWPWHTKAYHIYMYLDFPTPYLIKPWKRPR